MKQTKWITVAIISVIVLACHQPQNNTSKQKITVAAGAGMKEVVTEIIDSFKVHYPNVEFATNWAASGVLAKQMKQGNVPDVFFAANKKWVDYVDSLGLVVNHQRAVIAKNELVLVAPKHSAINPVQFGNQLDLNYLIGDGHLSIGDPSYVPVGAYAKQSLEYYGLFDNVKSKLMMAKDVRSALWVVELGEAPLGIVFRSESYRSKKVKELAVIPAKSHKPIVFIASLCSVSSESEAFYKYLKSNTAQKIILKNGFIL